MVKKKDYLYILCAVEAERKPVHYPKSKSLSKSWSLTKKTNKNLSPEAYDLQNVRVWVPVVMFYADTLLATFETSRLLRKIFSKKWDNLSEYVLYMYEEYVAWLSYMKTQDLAKNVAVKPLKKHYLKFFSIYNGVYYLNAKHQKHISIYNYKLNPLIEYWFQCQDLQKQLELPEFTIFLPYLSSLTTILKYTK